MEGFYHKCFTSDFAWICYFGYFFLLFGIVSFIFNVFAFIKMTKYYKKMNFENTILLLSSIQSIILIIQMMLSKTYFVFLFLFIQILSMHLINNKFRKISIGYINIKYDCLNTLIKVINVAYIILYIIIYIISYIIKITLKLFYLNIFYFFLEIFTSFFLAYHCRLFLGFINKGKLTENLEKKNSVVDKNNDNNNEFEDKKKSENFLASNMIGDGLFYLIKKKQLSLLYLANIICSSSEFIFDMIVYILEEKKNTSFYLINYIYDFIYFIHNSIIFISFYWLIREQYENKPKLFIKNKEEKDEKLIDEKIIEEEANNIEEENKRITVYINEGKNLFRKTSTESNEEGKIIKKKISDKELVRRKPSRNSTFDENEEIIGPNIINIENLPSNE